MRGEIETVLSDLLNTPGHKVVVTVFETQYTGGAKLLQVAHDDAAVTRLREFFTRPYIGSDWTTETRYRILVEQISEPVSLKGNPT